MRNILIALAILAAAPVIADPVEEVRQAEIAFAKAFADRDQQKFFSMVASDATFLGPKDAFSGRPEVIKGWSGFFKAAVAPFSWAPERVHVNAAGNLGFSYGPIRDGNGKHFANYTSIWQKQRDGSWKVVFDGPGAAVCPPAPPNTAAVEEGFIPTADGPRLYYRKVGNGPRTVIVPLGFVLYEDFKEFSDTYTMIFYDLRNRGRSDPLKDLSTVSIQQDVKDLETVRRHFNVERFSPIGYSYLGLMVAMYALDHPNRVDRIVQIGPVGFGSGATYPPHLKHTADDLQIPEADKNAYREMVKAGAREASPREFCEQQWKVMQYYYVGTAEGLPRLRPGNCDLENEWPSNFSRHIERLWPNVQAVRLTRDDLMRLQQPVLTIHGTKDRNAPYGAGREWAMTVPNGRLLAVEGAAHAAWADQPDVVFNAVRQFLAGEWPQNVERVSRLDPKPASR